MNNEQRYVVRQEATIIGTYFHVMDTHNNCQVSKDMLFRDDAEKTASRMNCQHNHNQPELIY